MKKIFTLILTVLALSFTLQAQDARQRSVETIVGDVVAQMPAQNAEALASDMLDLAKTAPESVVKLAAMLQNPAKGANNRIEYAINGLTNFAATPANQAWKGAVKEGLQKAIAACTDPVNKQFLESQLWLLGTPDNTVVTAPIDSKVLRKDATSQEKCEALYLKEKVLGVVPDKDILKAVTDKSRLVRATALRRYAPPTSDFAAKVAKKFKKLGTEGKVDVLNWLGDNKIESQLPLILGQFGSEKDIACAAIEAAGKIGGDDAADALIGQLGGDNAAAALKALKSFPGDLKEKVATALEGASGTGLSNLLALAGSKGMANAAERIFALAAEGDPGAIQALSGVAKPDDIGRLAGLLDKAKEEDVPGFTKGFSAAIKTLTPDEKYDHVIKIIEGARHPERFFPALAQSGTDAAVNDLVKAAEAGSPEAVKALGKTGNYKAAPALLAAGRAGNLAALKDYVSFVDRYEKDVDRKCNALTDALGATKDPDLLKNFLAKLGNTPTSKAFAVAGSFLDNADTDVAASAAQAAKNIAAKCVDDLDATTKADVLGKAIRAFQARGTADDGYAVDEIKKMLSETKAASPIFTLSDEERKAGFEMLFDGTNLDKWTGNKEGYRITNNEIYVTSGYGNGGNLYTEKEYRDFVFRFEFSFVRPGANNGVGVRTPHGVDAAYGGMCEVQVLDHDDPIYAGWLKDYQVHGSVYGVIPAKRIQHKPLGEWSCEEIRVQGDHITVTVNGEVIVDGDIREACQGHNVAPDGGNVNPYTVDHHNHPGMFNEKGYIGFLGHGPGVKFRNVRVLDLTPAAKGKKR
jgi:hypothetical protein